MAPANSDKRSIPSPDFMQASPDNNEGIVSDDDDDHDFSPSAEMLMNDFDEEATMEEEEQMEMEGGNHDENEIQNLQQEAEMPIGELLERYMGGHNNAEGSSNEAGPSDEPGPAPHMDEFSQFNTNGSDGDEAESMDGAVMTYLRTTKEINIGSDFQAEVPETTGGESVERGDKLQWCGSILSDKMVDDYIKKYKFIVASVQERVFAELVKKAGDASKNGDTTATTSGIGKNGETSASTSAFGKNEETTATTSGAATGDEGKSAATATETCEECDKMIEMMFAAYKRGNAFKTFDDIRDFLKDTNLRLTGGDDEQALILLGQCHYDTDEALRRISLNSILSSQHYNWSRNDCEQFEAGFREHRKHFERIRRDFLSHKQCTEIVWFYYHWKKSKRHDQLMDDLRGIKCTFGSSSESDDDPDGPGTP